MKKITILSFAAALLIAVSSASALQPASAETLDLTTDITISGITGNASAKRGRNQSQTAPGAPRKRMPGSNEQAAPPMDGEHGGQKGNMGQIPAAPHNAEARGKEGRKGNRDRKTYLEVAIDSADSLSMEEKALLKADQQAAEPIYTEWNALRTEMQKNHDKLKTLSKDSEEFKSLTEKNDMLMQKVKELGNQLDAIFEKNRDVWSKLGLQNEMPGQKDMNSRGSNPNNPSNQSRKQGRSDKRGGMAPNHAQAPNAAPSESDTNSTGQAPAKHKKP